MARFEIEDEFGWIICCCCPLKSPPAKQHNTGICNIALINTVKHIVQLKKKYIAIQLETAILYYS